ncbi:MAG: phosphocholine cytidylyltransferase family protein [Ignavibacteriae bacterium]|nr:phosphocholine cytidylyltransferase family protein [Ignavibacteriota bacterium]
MKAVILAAGISARLRPLTDNTPKCLLKVGAKSILERTIDNLIANEINDVIVVTGYLKEMIEDFLQKKYPKLNFTFIYNDKYDSTNNIYSLWMTKDRVLGNDILLLDSDIIFDSRIIGQLLNSNHENCLSVRSDHELGVEEIKILINVDKSIREISKLINPLSAVGESIGIEKFNSNFVEHLFKVLDKKIIEQKKVNIFYEAAFQDAINEGAKIFPIDVENYKCVEIDTAEDFEIAATLVEGIS